MESILIMLYALLSLNTSQIKAHQATGEGMDEMELTRLVETGDDIRREIQEVRNNL